MKNFQLDPVKYEVFYQRMQNFLEESRNVVMNISCSPIVREAGEVCEAFLLPDGEISLMSTGLLTHVNGLTSAVQHMKEQRFSEDIGVFPGDQFINSDCQIGGIHRMDMIMVAPFFYQDKFLGWVGNLTHVFEIGAVAPGGVSPEQTEACHDGIYLPCVKVVERGKVRRDIMQMMAGTVRDPRYIDIDTRAKIAGNERAIQLLTDLVDEFGMEFFENATQQFGEDAEEHARKILKSLRPGIYRTRVFNDFISPTQEGMRMMEVAIEISAEGTMKIRTPVISSQSKGYANCALPGIHGYILCFLLVYLFYQARWNGAIMRPVTIDIPPGSMLSADGTVSVALCSTAVGFQMHVALADPLSRISYASGNFHDVIAPSGLVTCWLLGGIDQHGRIGGGLSMDAVVMGGGARYNRDGSDTGVCTVNPHNLTSDIEMDESTMPTVQISRRHVPDSGGFGKNRGGTSGQSMVTVSNTPYAMISSAGFGKHVTIGQGLFGGYPAACSRRAIMYDTDFLQRVKERKLLPHTISEMKDVIKGTYEELHPSSPMRQVKEGDLVVTTNWGGGGLGDPLERDPSLVVKDLENGLTTLRAAGEVYGIIIDPESYEVDYEKTEQKREEIRGRRLKEGVPARQYVWQMIKKRENRELPQPVLDFFDQTMAFCEEFKEELEREKRWANEVKEKNGKKTAHKELFDLTPYVKIVENGEGKKLAICSKCEHEHGNAQDNFKLHCLIYDQDPKEIQPGEMGPDKDWMIYREFYCPGCGTQVEVEATPPGMPILHSIELKF